MSRKKSKFKNIIKHKSGYTWSKDQELNMPEGDAIRVLTVTNIQEKLDLRSELYLKNVSEKDRSNNAVSKDWCIAVSSNGNRNRIGNAVYIDNDLDYLFASFLTAFKPKEDADITSKYFYYWLTSQPIQTRITAVSEGTTGLGNLDLRYLRNMEINYPDNKPEQGAIVKILSTIDEAIAATEQSIKAAERLKKSMMQNLLTGKLKPNGTWRTEDEFETDEKFGKYPKGWKLSRFKDFSVLQRGKDLTDNEVIPGKIPVVKSNGVQIYHNKSFLLPPGIVTGRSGTIGKVFYIKEPYWAHNTTLYIKDFKRNNPKYIYYLVQRMQFDRYYAGTTVPTLNRNDIHRVKVAYPTKIDEQEQIAKQLDSVSNFITIKEMKMEKLRKLKKSLMQNLLTGKIRLDVEKIKTMLGEKDGQLIGA